MPAATRRHWIVKQEPTAYAWDTFLTDGGTTWTGVRNFQARANLRAMRKGDLVLFYHSVVGKEIVGIAKVTREAYRDPTADEDGWDCVDLAPVRPLKRPVRLAEIKAHPELNGISLVRQSRLSVVPLAQSEYEAIVSLSMSGVVAA
jgi:predicted RNA-binding protein with PUA-like domain